ncbi:hypothetical protein [Roseiconus lacunae]|uniref:Uncharacterized protein n=1 Tax=Roseiconus lacunae TaxID=2605694 RepID=A0ABT7PM30_9BACT|nr:hypothetical protein [Roseiconus lacunae]MDM4017564.1 hypothetical protein [Roseiconus lacunae]
MTDVNPYANTVVEDDGPTELTFDSIIELEDYQRMLRRSFPERTLVIVLISLLGFTAIAPLVLVASISIWRQDTEALLPVILFSLVVGAIAVAVYRYFFHSDRRVMRSIEKHPDLLGIVRGRLTAAGMTLDDGVRHHWFSPRQLVTAVISPAGIRIPLTDDPYRFLAMTERIFDHYSVKTAKGLRERWFEYARDPSDDVPSMWDEVNPPPGDAIHFHGAVTMQQSTRTPRTLVLLIANLVGAAALLSIAGTDTSFFSSWSDYFMVGYGVFALFNGIRSAWFYYKGTRQQTWNQRGWTSGEELAIQWTSVGIRISLSEIERVEILDEVIVLSSQSGGSYYLMRIHFESEADWETLCNRCQKLASSMSFTPAIPSSG